MIAAIYHVFNVVVIETGTAIISKLSDKGSHSMFIKHAIFYNPQNEMLAVSKTKRILTQNEAYSKLQIFLINKSCIFQNKHDLFF